MVDQGNQLSEGRHDGGGQARLSWNKSIGRVIRYPDTLHSDGDLETVSESMMTLKNSSFWSSLAFANLLFVLGVTAQDGNNPFTCHVKTNDLTYDLTPLKGEHTVTRTRDTPPSSWVDSVRFDLCADLKPQDGVASGDQVRVHPPISFRVVAHEFSTLHSVS